MILGFKTHFPDGTETRFWDKIYPHKDKSEFGNKIHAFRQDRTNRWRRGMKIHFAIGVRTKDYICFHEGVCTGAQRVWMEFWLRPKGKKDHVELSPALRVKVDGRNLKSQEIRDLMKNDGLTFNQFMRWFFLKGTGTWEGKIIHWTDKRY